MTMEPLDERRSVLASSHAAAQLLADRLAELGDGSALLAIASYNMGDLALTKLLHEVAVEGGGWHSGRLDYQPSSYWC